MQHHQPFKRKSSALVYLVFVCIVITPTLIIILGGLLGPSPFLVDTDKLGRYANKARLRQGATVETRVYETNELSRETAKRFLNSKPKKLSEVR